VAAALVLLVALVDSDLRHAGFVNFDDEEYVTRNPRVQAGLGAANVAWAFRARSAGNWHPLTWLSHMADVELFGLDPRGHHLTSVILHALAAIALFLALSGLSGSPGPSLAVAALWAVHPLNVETVAWVAQRKTVLAELFGFLCLLAWSRWLRDRKVRWYVMAASLLMLGLLSKPVLVTWPLLLVLLHAWPLDRTRAGRLDLEPVPLLPFCALSAVLTWQAQTAGAAVRSLEELPAGARLANALVSVSAYLHDAIVPTRLAVFHPLAERSWSESGVVGAALLVAGLTLGAVLLRRTRPWLTLGWAWFLLTLVPVIGLVQVGGQARADRYMSIPMVGLLVAVAWEVRERLSLRAAAMAAAASTLVLASLAHAQVAVWRSSTTLFAHAREVAGPSVVVSLSLALAHAADGRYEDALRSADEAVGLDPLHVDAHVTRGAALLALGRREEAAASFRRALALDPTNAAAARNLAAAAAGRSQEPETSSMPGKK
jgi:tetratricopeptide (TPR) repeat protein